MPKYHAEITYTQDCMAAFEFVAKDDDHAYEILNKDLPPLDNLKIQSLTLVGVDDEQLKKLN